MVHIHHPERLEWSIYTTLGGVPGRVYSTLGGVPGRVYLYIISLGTMVGILVYITSLGTMVGIHLLVYVPPYAPLGTPPWYTRCRTRYHGNTSRGG